MKILVTGGAGFIGSHIQDAYIEQGHNVCVMDNLYTGRKEFVHPEATFYKLDIRDGKTVNNIFADEKFDVVNHHAAQMDVRASVENPMFDADVNIVGGLNLLEASIKNRVKKFIFASTGGAIYGEQDYSPADEKHPLRPESPYGVAKLSFERYLYYYGVVYGLKYTILRYANIYGPRQNPHGEAGVVAIFSQLLVNGEIPTINGDGLKTRDFVNVTDVVKSNLAALEFKGDSVTVNIGTGIETNINEIFQHLKNTSGTTLEAIHGPDKKGEQQRSVLDNSFARETLNWSPTINIQDGLNQTYTYFLNNKGDLF